MSTLARSGALLTVTNLKGPFGAIREVAILHLAFFACIYHTIHRFEVVHKASDANAANSGHPRNSRGRSFDPHPEHPTPSRTARVHVLCRCLVAFQMGHAECWAPDLLLIPPVHRLLFFVPILSTEPHPPDYTDEPMARSQSPIQLDVAVVGAGIGGLASAISVAQAGYNVIVFESAKELAEVGAGLQLTPNCTKILQRYGLSDAFWATAAEPTTLTVHRYTGSVLAYDENFARTIRARYSAPFLDMHRCDLQQALYQRALDLGVSFRFSSKITDMELDLARPAVITKDGIRTAVDLIIAADGLWSRCRSRFLGYHDPPKATGDLAYRVVLTLDQIEDPELRRWVSEPTCHFWIGPGAHAVGYSLRGGKMYNIVLLVPDDLPEGVSRQPGSVEEMKALFKGWDSILSRFLELVDSVDKWKLMHRKSTVYSLDCTHRNRR
jgi:2-polyprenyl-6-methoxyphenol hydroxylase-like FAD-dependent oxidoreductase